MERIPEPELMQDETQARAYAEADFSEPHDRFVSLFRDRFGSSIAGPVLDLGCGPGDICLRFARAYPDCEIHGVDAAEAMLALGRERATRENLAPRVRLFSGYLPGAQLPRRDYPVLISNSLLHHLREPMTLWHSLCEYGADTALVFVMDLLRPESPGQAARLVEDYAANEPEVLRRDFHNSLLAAYRPDEVREQLGSCGLRQLRVETVSDRHWIAYGRLGRRAGPAPG